MDNRIDFRGKSLTVDDAGTRSVMCRQKNAGVPRVFLVGDSQTFGQGLSDRETWASILQCQLRDAKFSGQIYNLGVPGVNIDSVHRMRQVVPVLRDGDRVIVGVTWNDLHTFHEKFVMEWRAWPLGVLNNPVVMVGWKCDRVGPEDIFTERLGGIKPIVLPGCSSPVLTS